MTVSIDGLLIVGLLLLINTFLGLIVILRNPRAILNRVFVLMIVGITAWATASALSDATTNFLIARYASSIAFGASFFGFCATYLFSQVFRHGALGRTDYLTLTFGTLLSILYATPLVYSLDTLNDYHNGPLYIPYLLSVGCFLVLIIKNFYVVIRKGDPLQRSHARLIIAGFLAMAVLALITNAIIPAVVDVTWITKIGPVFTTLFLGSVAYSMIRLHLFDMRLAVARTLAYILTLVVIAAVYSTLLIGVLSHFIDMSYSSWLQPFAYVVMAVVMASTFQPIKKFFDRITNRLFYRDAYDAQDLFDQLNKVLVSSLDMHYLLTQSTTIIETALKLDYALVWLQGGKTHRTFGTAGMHVSRQLIDQMRPLVTNYSSKVIAADYLEDSKNTELKDIMDANGISVLLRLSQDGQDTDASLGYIILGGRKSGNPYALRDLNVLDTIANELIITIQNALRYEEIERFNVTLQSNIKEATSELRTTNRKLHELDESKDEFISMASHQLRTPLTSVKGYISMLLEGDVGKVSNDQRKVLEEAFNSSQRMVYLIGDFLNVSRLQTGKFELEYADVDMARIINEEIDQLRANAASRKITLRYQAPSNFPFMSVDENKIRQVMMNFIDNAIYYSLADTVIDISLTNHAGKVVFKVVDHGIGVPVKERHMLFTKFFRATNAKKQRPDGTGIGLFMAKKVIVAHGGSIIFESVVGKGSTFGFSLPLKKVNQPVDHDDKK